MAELNEFCTNFSPDLIAVSETWFQCGMTESELSISNMSLLRRDRISLGGGVAVYYNQRLLCTEVEDVCATLPDTLWCLLHLDSGEDCLVGVVYRSPSATDEHNDRLLEQLRMLTSTRQVPILLMGDFNLPNLYTRDVHPTYTMSYRLCELFDLIPLYNHVFEHTRMTGRDQPSVLDLILTSEETAIERIDYEAPLGRSDHVVLVFDFVCSAKRLSDETKIVRKINNHAVREALSDLNDQYLDYRDTNSHWATLSYIIQQRIDENSRFVTRRKPQDFRFVCRSRTKKWIALRNRAWTVHRTTNSESSWTQYRKLRNKVTYLVREDKLQFQMSLTSKMETNPKLLYRIVNDQAKVKPGVFSVQDEAGLTRTAQETANALAKFYSQVFTPKEILPLPIIPSASETLDDILINPTIVTQHLLRLNIRKSPGADGITPLTLKVCCYQLSQPLSHLFNQSIKEGKIPEEWKSGVISPIYKGGCRSDVANYRPVTLLSAVSKVMERILTEQILNHLETHHLLSVAQHGFRRYRSCLSNLLTTLNDWTQALDEGSCVHACYLDISKAFDRVNHDLLLKKLQKLGIKGNLLTWLQDYLCDRHVRVCVDGVLSERVAVTSGVPQGSVLGPILFLIYVNDLPPLMMCKVVMFADDIKLWTRIKSVDDCLVLQRDLDTLHDWSISNKLPFNFTKCKMLQVGKKFDFTYHLGLQELVWSSAEKDLGVWICSNLKSNTQSQAVFKRTSRLLGILRRIFGRFSPITLPRILNTYLRPSMEYAIQAWAPWMRKDVSLLDRIYHRATKLVTGFQHLPYNERLQRLNILDFTQRRIRSDLILTFKILRVPDHPLKHLFQRVVDRTTRGHCASVIIPRSRRDCRRYFFSVRVTFIWNALPEDIVSATCVPAFKSKLDAFVRQRFFHLKSSDCETELTHKVTLFFLYAYIRIVIFNLWFL